MRRIVRWWPLALLVPACVLFRHPVRPARASPEEAARVRFPTGLEEPGRMMVPAALVTAMQLALDDFLPLDAKPHAGADAVEACLYERESYEVGAVLGSEGVTFVSVVLRPGLCQGHGPILDWGVTYAIDVPGRRVLAVR